MMSTENLLSLSTASMGRDDRPRRYLSADDAVGSYLKLRALVEACPALDYTRLGDLVQSEPSCENPHLERLSEIWFLEAVFTKARTLAGEKRWEHWVRVRVHGEILRAFKGVSKSTIQRHVVQVDGYVEEELAGSYRMVRSQVRGAVA